MCKTGMAEINGLFTLSSFLPKMSLVKKLKSKINNSTGVSTISVNVFSLKETFLFLVFGVNIA